MEVKFGAAKKNMSIAVYVCALVPALGGATACVVELTVLPGHQPTDPRQGDPREGWHKEQPKQAALPPVLNRLDINKLS